MSYLYEDVLVLLKTLIETPSLSKQEDKSAAIIYQWLQKNGIEANREGNNVWAKNKHFNTSKPTVLLNSHHDTVAPNKQYTLNPFEPIVKDGKLYGLGSNDAGASVVALLATFLAFYMRKDLSYNLLIALTAEEEISGKNGITAILPLLPSPAFAIVGEPTEMHMAIAEKGLLVIDACAEGIPGHAAHNNVLNPIYLAMKDIAWISKYQFKKESNLLGKVKMSVSQIGAGVQHNQIPATCEYVIDVRVNDQYTNQKVFDLIDANTTAKLSPRSFRLNPSSIPKSHPIVIAGESLGRKSFGSPTLSDQALIPYPSLKIGPGKTERSHTADEFIYLHEIKEGIEIYTALIEKLNSHEIVG